MSQNNQSSSSDVFHPKGKKFTLEPVTAKGVHESLKKSGLLVDGFDIVCNYATSKGCNLVDDMSGRVYHDFFGGFGSSPLGFNHPSLDNDAFMRAARNSVINKPSNADLYSVEYEAFLQAFAKYVLPEGYKHVFFIDGGALAVENGVKAAIDWKVRRNREKGVKSEVGQKIIHFKQAFHGRSGYTMSLTNTDPTKVYFFPKFDWPRVSAPAIHDDPATVVKREEQSLKEIDDAFEKYGDDIAAIIIEPIQCEGGDRHFRSEFLQALEQCCRKNDCLFICDEVQTGFFTSGKKWCFEHYGIKPDIVCFGKKAQQCGIFAGPRMDEVKGNVFETPSRINSTWGGNLIDMVRATWVIKAIVDDDLEDNARDMGAYWLSKVQELSKKYKFILHPRAVGLIMAFDLKDRENRNLFLNDCSAKGLIVLTSGIRTIRFRPHLAITKKDVDKCIELLTHVMEDWHTTNKHGDTKEPKDE